MMMMEEKKRSILSLYTKASIFSDFIQSGSSIVAASVQQVWISQEGELLE